MDIDFEGGFEGNGGIGSTGMAGGHDDLERQSGFVGDVHAFLSNDESGSRPEGDGEGGASGGDSGSQPSGAWQGGLSPLQRLQLEEASRLKGFLDAGQVRMPGAVGVGANGAFGPGTGAAAGTNPDTPASGSSAGNAPGASPENQGAGGGRDAWEKWKGLDPATQTMMHGTVWPVNNIVTSPFGPRIHPITKEPGKPHGGVDIRNALGGDVVASRAGVVTNVNPASGGENQVVIQYDNGAEGSYMHTNPKIEVGQRVWAGTKIGETDMSGQVNGPHLHYQYKIGQDRYDPLKFLPKK